MTITGLSHITVYVTDQDAALSWYRDMLGFEVVMDNHDAVPQVRWLTMAPAGNADIQFVLALAHSADEKSRVGNNLMTVLRSDDCRADMLELERRGVEIVDGPAEEPWGISGIFRDLYGNPYNLVGPKP